MSTLETTTTKKYVNNNNNNFITALRYQSHNNESIYKLGQATKAANNMNNTIPKLSC